MGKSAHTRRRNSFYALQTRSLSLSCLTRSFIRASSKNIRPTPTDTSEFDYPMGKSWKNIGF